MVSIQPVTQKSFFFTIVPETCKKSAVKHFLENLVLFSFVIYLQSLVQECLRKHTFISNIALREKCQNTELFLVRIFLYSDWVQENMDQK